MINLLPVLLLWIFPLSSHLHDGVEEAGVAQVVDALNGDEGAVRCALASPLAVLGLLAKLDDFRHRSCQHTHTHTPCDHDQRENVHIPKVYSRSQK